LTSSPTMVKWGMSRNGQISINWEYRQQNDLEDVVRIFVSRYMRFFLDIYRKNC